MTINNTLGWTDAVVNTCNRVFAAVHTLKRMQLILPFHVKMLLVKSLVFPHFNYCNSVINDMTVDLSSRLQKAQNYCIRFLFNLQWSDRVTPYYIQSSILKLADQRTVRIASLTQSVMQSGLPAYLAQNFHFVDEGGARTRSGSSMLRIPHHRTTAYNKSFLVTACRTWNSLPDHIKQTENRSAFLAGLKEYFLDRMSAAEGFGR